jgi:hypothetical protein
MTNIALIVGFGSVLVGCAVAYGRVRAKLRAKNSADRRAYLKGRARSL